MLTQHINSQKDGTLKLYICFECNKSFPSKARLSVHSKVHTDYPRPFSCNFCEYKTHKTYNLTIHLETHNDQTYNCHLCEKKYNTQMSLSSNYSSKSGHHCIKVKEKLESILLNFFSKNMYTPFWVWMWLIPKIQRKQKTFPIYLIFLSP